MLELYHFCSFDIEKYNVVSLDAAYSFVKKIAKKHYENFPVGSILVPKRLRKYIYSIYSFARVADDIADEISKENVENALALLDKYEYCLDNCLTANEINNPIFLALKDTIITNNLPIELFKRLLKAFRQDINFQQANTFDDLFDYCNNSANPVGELILRLFKEDNEQTIFYSNKICSALQLINFLQDISIDLKRKRNYIPKELLYSDISVNEPPDEINIEALNKYIAVIERLLNEGKYILKLIKSFRLKLELYLIILGGRIILTKINRTKTKLLKKRPKVMF